MAEAKVIVSAENRLKQGLDDAKKDLLGFGDAAESIGEKLKNALTVTAIAVGLEKLGKAAFDCFVEFGEGERRIKQLKIALDNNETSFNRAIRLIDEMRGMSLASKDQIEGLVAELATLGKSDAEIDKITRAAVNLSNVTGQDLNSAFTLINGTFTGTAGELEKLIPELGDLTKEQLAAGGAADIINGKFGEMSKQLAEDNIPQKIKNIKDGWDDLKQNFGQAVAPIFNPILDGINSIITGWNKAAEAADLHYKVLRATSYTSKIALYENIVQNTQERLRLWDQQNSATVERIKRNIEQAKRVGDVSAQKAAEEALDVLLASRQALVTELDTAKATITDLKKLWAQTPASLLNPQDKITIVPKFSGTTSGDPDQTKTLKANYKTVDGIYKDLTEFIGIMENHPDYYSSDQIQSFIKSVQPRVYGAELLQLGPEGTALLDDVRTLLQSLGATVPETTATSKASDALSPADLAWSKNFEGLARASVSISDLVRSYGRKNNLPGVMAELKSWLSPAIATLKNDTTSGAADALSPADSAWSKRYQAAYDAWDEQRQIKEYWEQHPLTGADLERSQAMNELGLRSTTQPLLTALPTPPPPPQWQPPMTQQEEAMGLALNEKGAQYFIDQFNKKLLNPLDSFARHYTEAAKKAAEVPMTPQQKAWGEAMNARYGMQPYELTGGVVYGQSTLPGPIGGGGLNAFAQVQAFQDTISLFDAFKGNLQGLLQALPTIGSQFGGQLLGSGLSTGGAMDGIMAALAPLASALQPILQIVLSANPLMAALIPIVQAMVQTLQPVISSLLDPLMGILTIIGQTLGAVLAPVLKALSPIIELIGKAFVWLYNNVIRPIANGLIWIFTAVQNAIARVINAFRWLTGISVQYASYEDAKLQKIEYGDVVQAGANAAGATAAQSAQYRSQSITINIYQQSPVVGDGGMRQFAAMIRAEFEALAYYGT